MKRSSRRYSFPDGSNYPIVESSVGMILPMTESDVVRGTTHNPYECALAQCAMRVGAEKAFIAGTVAYVVMTYKGEKVAMRFEVPPHTRRAIKHFDETDGREFPPEGFVLNKLKPSKSSAVKKVYNASRPPEQRKWGGTKKGAREELRTYRYLTGQVRTIEDE